MTSALLVTDTAVVHAMRMGALRISPYGFCAAVGLIASVAAASRAARYALVKSDAVWDVGLFAVMCCLLASRLLLVLRDPVAFKKYPLLVLSLPSLTFGGMAVAAVMMILYLRRKRLPLLSLLDVFAPAGALLAVFLEFGHWLDGSETGMPSRLPWAIRDRSVSATLRFHPVALYGVMVALLLAMLLGTMLRRHLRRGLVAGAGLMLGAIAAFVLDMFTQPGLAATTRWLEPGQWVALLAMVAGAVLWSWVRIFSTHDNSFQNADGFGSSHLAALHMEVR